MYKFRACAVLFIFVNIYIENNNLTRSLIDDICIYFAFEDGNFTCNTGPKKLFKTGKTSNYIF